MRRQGIKEQVMAKCLQNKKRAFDKRIVSRQIVVVPNPLARQGGRMHDDRDQAQEQAAKPIRSDASCDLWQIQDKKTLFP